MNLAPTLLLLTVLLTLAITLQPLARRLRLPLAATLLLTGFLGSEALVATGRTIALDYRMIHDLAFFGLLPLLVFSAGLRLDPGRLRENLAPIAWLALPMPLAICLLSAAFIWWGIGHPDGFPWSTALVAGAILTATEPFPLRNRLRGSPPCRRLAVVLEAEGLINIAVAVVLYQIAIQFALLPPGSVSGADVALGFLWSLSGGAAWGIVISLLALFLSRRLQSPQQQTLVAVTTAYLAFLGAEHWLGGSGIVAAIIAGLFFGRATRADFSDQQEVFQEQFWGFISHIAGAVIFLVMGISFTLPLFQERWLAMLIGIAALLAVRAPQTLVAWLAFRFTPGVPPLNAAERRIGYTAGLRGAVALALALAIPIELTAWWTVHAMVFGVVLFSLVVQAPLADWLIDRAERKTP